MAKWLRFLRFLRFFENPKKHDFLLFLRCCTGFLEHWEADRRMDDMQSQYRALHYNASRGKNTRMMD